MSKRRPQTTVITQTKHATGTHSLQLYSSLLDKYVIHSAFLSGAAAGKAFYVTRENKQSAAESLAGHGATDTAIISPNELHDLKCVSGAHIVADCDSFKQQDSLESGFCEMNGNDILCTYNISRTDPDKIKSLVESHDKFILSSPETTVLSYSSLKNLGNDAVEKVVKNDLELFVLAMVNAKPMTGMEMIKLLHKDFDVMVSPGRIYPLLKDLEERGLVSYEYLVRNKVYKVKNTEEVQQKLVQKTRVSMFLSTFFEKQRGAPTE